MTSQLSISLPSRHLLMCLLSSSVSPVCYPIVIVIELCMLGLSLPPKEQCWKGCGCFKLNTLIHWGLEAGGSFHVLIFYRDPILLNGTRKKTCCAILCLLRNTLKRERADFSQTFSDGLEILECLSYWILKNPCYVKNQSNVTINSLGVK